MYKTTLSTDRLDKSWADTGRGVMLSSLQTSYQRLEQSLQRLTDSIVTYNPSVSAAEELETVDNEISQELNTLSKHQSNYARILELRQTSESLDATLKNTVRLLAETRREIQAIPAHHDREDGKELQIEELLSYAKFISKTSVQQSQKSEDKDDNATDTNGIKTESIGLKNVDEQVKRNLDPLRDMPFEPWPPYDVIQRGSLADIQRLRDAGKDPATILSAEDQAEADRLKREQEEQEKAEQEERDRRRMSLYPGSIGRHAVQDDVFDPDA